MSLTDAEREAIALAQAHEEKTRRPTVAALEEMDEAYLVSTLEVPALHQAKQVLQILMDAGYGKDRIKLILNRVPKRSELAPGEIEKILGLPQDYRPDKGVPFDQIGT